MISKVIRSIKRKTFIYDVWNFLYVEKRLFRLLNFFVPFLKLNPRKIVFCSFYGANYGCNPKYITEELIKKGIDCELVWLVEKKWVMDTKDFPEVVRIVRYLSIWAFFELATAKIWIDNCRKFLYPNKKKNQYYIQTWHGAICLKKIEKDFPGLSARYVESAKNDSLKTDFCISNGRHITNIYKNAFWYPNHVQILEYGSPRNDLLVNNTGFNHIKEKLPVDEHASIVLYAPTFRENYSFDVYKLDYKRIIDTLESRYGGNWVFLVRLHPNLILYKDKLNIPDNVIDVTLYPDVQELLGISNVIISDYSSLMFDFMFTKRPCFIYAIDYASFKNQRDVYFPLHELPFLVAEDNDELIMNIMSLDHEKYNKMVETFIEHIGCFEHGTASKMTIDKIQSLMAIRNRGD